MKKKYFLPIALIALLATGCTKEFLDRKPLDSIDDSNFWTNEANLRMHSIYYYSTYFRGYGDNDYNPVLPNMSSYLTDIIVSGGSPGSLSNGNSGSGPAAGYNGYGAAALNCESWSSNYIWIRRANTFIERLNRDTKAALSDEVYRHWMGIARYLRAQRFIDLVWGFGDVPYFNTIPTENLEDLCIPRANRYDILDSCINDIQYAVDNCREDDGGNNMLNRYSIAALGSRWFYWLGCFQKYVPSEYAGGNTEAATKYLNKAVEWANVVISSGKYSITEDFRSLFASDDLSGSTEAVLARYYNTSQVKNAATSYFGNMNDSARGFSAHFMRNVILFWDGTLQPGETTVLEQQGITPTDTDDRYDKLYTMIDNALLKNKDSRLEAMLKSSRVISSTADANTGAMSREYISSGSTRYFPRICMPREYEDYMAGAALTVNWLQGASNTVNAPIIRYAEVLLNWVCAKAELADGLGGAAVTQADLDASVELIRARPVATGGNNPSLQPNRLPKFTLGQYPTDPERELEGFTSAAKALIWELRRERTVELAYDWVRNRDLRAYGQQLNYIYRYDGYPGRYNHEPSQEINNYFGQYYGGDPVAGWGNKDMSQVNYFVNNPEGNLLQCGAYFNMEALYDRAVASAQAAAASGDAADIAQANEWKLALDAFASSSPGLWIVRPDGEQRLFPDYKLAKWDAGDYSFYKKTAYTDADYTVKVEDAEARAVLEYMKGWWITGRSDLRSSAQQTRSWLACIPINQITYYREHGYDVLTQNPGYQDYL